MRLSHYSQSAINCEFCGGSGLREVELERNIVNAWACATCGHLKSQHWMAKACGGSRRGSASPHRCSCRAYVEKPWGRRAAVEHTKDKS